MREPTVKEAYHKIKKYFSKPGAELAYDEDGCKYRIEGKKVKKCAVGCLIPRSSYQPRYEFISVDNVFDAVGFFNPELRSFLKSAQIEHDSSNNVDSFLYSLEKLLRYYDDK